MNNDAILLKT